MLHNDSSRAASGMHEHSFRHTVPASFTWPFLEELGRLGCDVADLWHEARMSTSLTAVRRHQSIALPASEFARFYRLNIGELEARCCARDGGRPLGKLAVDMMCYALIHCTTLEKVIERAALFNRAMEERGADMQMFTRGTRAYFTIDTHRLIRDEAALLVDITGLNLHYQLFSWLVYRRLPGVEAGLAYPQPLHSNPLYEAYGMRLRWDQPVNYLSFPASCLQLKRVRSYNELERVIDFIPFRLGFGESAGGSIGLSIRLLLADALQHQGRTPSADLVAQLHHMSTASMRRRLHADGTSFSELLAACRREVAEDLLRQTDMPVAEVAQRIGLSSSRAFRRVFRQWTGGLPSAYRQEHSRR